MTIEPYLRRLADDTAFERYVLRRGVPVQIEGAAVVGGRYHLEANRLEATVHVTETLGMTLSDAVHKLGLLPLAFGAAWKVLDLLLESAFEAAGLTPTHGTRWTITEKTELARLFVGRARPISTDPDLWQRLLLTYAETEQVRHSLVHRRADVDDAGRITGVDRQGKPLRSLSAVEQKAACRAVQLAFAALQDGALSVRRRNRLLWNLDALSGISGAPSSGAYQPPDQIPQIMIEISEPYELDLTQLRSRFQVFASEREWDLLFELKDRHDQVLVHLEQAPNRAMVLDPANLPPWAMRLPPSTNSA